MRARWAVAVAAMLCAAAVAGCADSRHHSVGGSTPAEIGRLWQLRQIGHAGTTLTVAASAGVTLQLTSDGAYLASDGVNAISGRYRVTGTGLVLSSSMGTAVGYAGHDPARLGAIAAMQAVTSGAPVAVTVVGATMTMTVTGYALTFGDIGPAVVYPTPYGTPTAVSRTS